VDLLYKWIEFELNGLIKSFVEHNINGKVGYMDILNFNRLYYIPFDEVSIRLSGSSAADL